MAPIGQRCMRIEAGFARKGCIIGARAIKSKKAVAEGFATAFGGQICGAGCAENRDPSRTDHQAASASRMRIQERMPL